VKTPDGIHALAYALMLIGGDGIRAGRTGVRITLSPIPIDAENAHQECYSVDMEAAGLAKVTAKLSAPETGTEAA